MEIISESRCSSGQPTAQQPNQGEKQDLTSPKSNEGDAEVGVQLQLHGDENRKSISISESDNHETPIEGSSCERNENNVTKCGVNTHIEYSAGQCEETSSNSSDDSQDCSDTQTGNSAGQSEDSTSSSSSGEHTQQWCDPSMLLDNSVEEFSIVTEQNKSDINSSSKEFYVEKSLDKFSSDREGFIQSTHGNESQAFTHSKESKEDTDLDQTEQVESKDNLPPESYNQARSSHLQNEIHSLLSATSPLCSPVSELEVGRVDFATTPKENLMRMVSDLLDECDWLKKEKARLENEVDCLEADHSAVAYLAQVETLEKSLAQAQADACSWEQKLQVAEQNYMAENVRIRTDLTTRLERITKQYEAANKDKEAMVMKYATSEREVIVAKKQKEAVEKKMKEMEKEREILLSKNKMLISERARICQTLDTKVQKNNWYQREIDRLKDDLNGRDIKIKWMQTKLKSEMEAHEECQGKLDRALTKITKHEEEMKTIKEEAESIVQTAKQDENSRANVLDMQLKEEKARLIMERQANEDRGSAFSKVTMDLEELQQKHRALEEEATSLRARLSSRELEQEEMEKLFTSLRAEVTAARQEASDLNHQVSNSAHLQQQLAREKDQLERVNQEVERLQTTNNELESELLACRTKEAELLAFTQKLSDKNVQIQSELSALQSKTQLMVIEHEEMKAEVEELKSQRVKLKAELAKETQKYSSTLESLNQQLAEKTEEAKRLNTKAMDFENEVQVVTRKHNNSLKDITREMQKLRKRLEMQENSSSGGNESASGGVSSGLSSQSATPHDNLSQDSRASSNTSLNTLEYHNGTAPQPQEQLPPLNDPQVTQQLLVDRIIRLQKSAAKRAEKMEFLEEHNNQLIGEIKKKSRIIHHYIMREEAGALANSASDSSKAELMRHGGIMASVYGSVPRDGTMTLELSLEINRKLQAVLEDTLLKNITLKDNLNTLGDEIAKISQQKQAPSKKS